MVVDERPDVSASLIPPAARHDSESFLRWLHAEYGMRLLIVVRRYTDGDRYWAEDVVQETLMRAWRHAGVLLDGESASLLPWLATVARRIVLNDLRTRRSRPQIVDGDLLAVASVQDETEHLLLRAIIQQALAQLSPAHRQVIVEIYLRGRSLEEASAVIGVPIGTVKSRLHYALCALRAALSQQDR